MSQENVEVVVGAFKSTNARDFAAVMNAYADDAVLELHFEGVVGERVVGKRAVGQWFGDWFRTFDSDYHFEITETRDLGDRVFLVAQHHGRGRASGAPVTQWAAYVYTMRDRKVVVCDVYPKREQALEAVGLSE